MSDLKWKSLSELKEERKLIMDHLVELDLQKAKLESEIGKIVGRINNVNVRLQWCEKYIEDKSPKPPPPEVPEYTIQELRAKLGYDFVLKQEFK